MKPIHKWKLFGCTLMLIGLLSVAGCGGGGGTPASGTSGGNSSPPPPALGGTTALTPAGPTAVFSLAVAINDANTIVGTAETTAGSIFTAAFWTVDATGTTASAPTALESLTPGGYSSGFALDAAGDIVGQADDGLALVAVLWRSGSTTPEALPALFPGGFSTAYGISPDGNLIVGEAEDASFTTRAVAWPVNAGVVQSPLTLPEAFALPDLPGTFASAYAVNDAGWIVGEVEDDGGQSHAVYWQPDGNGGYTMGDLRGGGEISSLAQGINSLNQIVGESETSPGSFAPALWADDGTGEFKRTEVATVGGAASINDTGRIAGWDGPTPKARVWDADSLSGTDLFSTASQAYAINNNDLVVGHNGTEGFVRLTR